MNKKVVHIVGARPNFIKAAPVLHALKHYPNITQELVHTGQHYDEKMSSIFFDVLEMPKPTINLGIGSSKYHGEQIGKALIKLEKFFIDSNPDLVIVYGDVNSTLAGALAAVKLGIKLAHVEAGLRSFDLSMPEEINRMLVDRITDYNFITEHSGLVNLNCENIDEDKVFFVGNTMIDSLLKIFKLISHDSSLTKYALLTFHRPSNVDNEEGIRKILEICKHIDMSVVFPIHPRTKNKFKEYGLYEELESLPRVTLRDPVGYMEFVEMMKNSSVVITDSGGIQEETTVLGVPCLTLRDNTERPITVVSGTNLLVKNIEDIAYNIDLIKKGAFKKASIPHLWDGKAGQRIAEIINKELN